MFSSHNGEEIFLCSGRALGGICPNWQDLIISNSTDGERKAKIKALPLTLSESRGLVSFDFGVACTNLKFFCGIFQASIG